ELGLAITARYMRHAGGLESFVKDAKQRVVLEIEAVDVWAHRMVAERRAETQPAIVRSEREKVLLERRTLGARKLPDGYVHLGTRWTGYGRRSLFRSAKLAESGACRRDRRLDL